MANNVHDIINDERRKRGLRHVYWSREMASLARAQANYCAKVGRLVHSNRYAFQGGENLAQGGYKFTPRETVDCWLRSKAGHREYLLSPRVTRAGVGTARRNGKTFVAWAFSDSPATYPDCPYCRQQRPKNHIRHGRPVHRRDRPFVSTLELTAKRYCRLAGRTLRNLRLNARLLTAVGVLAMLVLVCADVYPFESWWQSATATVKTTYTGAAADWERIEADQAVAIEADILEYSNTAREEFGLPGLIRNSGLDRLAAEHCHYMVTTRRLGHDGFDERADAAWSMGISSFGENCAEGCHSGEAFVRVWLDSAGHRANILGAIYRATGIAYEGGYAVQVFGG